MVLGAALTFTGSAATAEVLPQHASYVLEDFASFVPWIWQGVPLAIGVAKPDDAAKTASARPVRLEWDLSRTEGGFVNFVLNRLMVGDVQHVRARVKTPAECVGRAIHLWMEDATGKTYIARTKLDKPGWHEISFHVAGLEPAWPSAGKIAGKVLPVKLVAIGFDEPKTQGHILIDSITVDTKGLPRDLVSADLVDWENRAFAWGPKAAWELTIRNLSTTTLPSLSVELCMMDELTKKAVWRDTVPVEKIAGGQQHTLPIAPPLKFGGYTLSWQVKDASDRLPSGAGSVRVAKFAGSAAAGGAGPAEKQFVRKWGMVGGVLAYATPERAAELGAAWSRHPVYWWDLEKTPGQFDLAPARNTLQALEDVNLDLVYFNALYDRPDFYRPDNLDFGMAYGRLFGKLAECWGKNVRWYEFGNEDNGPSKFIYTQIARHAAAAVRRANPDAILGNSGTAYVDANWLRMQARRGLFDRLDALVVHPYAGNSPPEAYGVFEQLAGLDAIIDDLGGMKIKYATEFGYPLELDEAKRAPWLVRNYVIGAAAGLVRHGLYTFDGHFGLCDGHRPLPSAVAINTFSRMIGNSVFAGWLRRDDKIYAAVFECAGQPTVVAWSPNGKEKLPLKSRDNRNSEAYDMFGNRVALPWMNDDVAVPLTGEPLYLRGVGRELLRDAWKQSLMSETARLAQVLTRSSQKTSARWQNLIGPQPMSAETLIETLRNWQPAPSPINLADQAVMAQAVRCLILAAKMSSLSAAAKDPRQTENSPSAAKWENVLAASVAEDLDIPSLRWLLLQWNYVADLAALSRERGNKSLAWQLGRVESVLNGLCAVMAKQGQKQFFAVWPYLYGDGGKQTELNETLSFVPGKTSPVLAQLSSYSRKEYAGTVRLELPKDWRCEPAEWRGTIGPEKTIDLRFLVTPGASSPDEVTAILEIPGKPAVKIPFDDLQLLPAIDVTVEAVPGPLPETALKLNVINRGDTPQTVTLRLLASEGLPPLARVEMSLQPHETKPATVALPKTVELPAGNEWKLIGELKTAGSRNPINIPLTIDFSGAVWAGQSPTIDGDLSDWKAALPLHLDKAEYTRTSFGRGWSPEDLSGTVYLMWDPQYLYFSAKVNDQLFQQELEGGDVWGQDSIQIIFAHDGAKKWTEFCLALTPKGPQVWKTLDGLAAGAKLAVKLSPGQAVYECAIPWSAFDGINAGPNQSVRFDVLFNDHDAIVSRRVMERYGVGIVNTKTPNDFGWLKFISPPTAEPALSRKDAPKPVFREDFEEYPGGSSPDNWHLAAHMRPCPQATVMAGVGRNGSKGLVVTNEIGKKPYTYLVLTRQVPHLQPGRQYTLRAWVKGGGNANSTRMIGVCSDLYACESATDIAPWQTRSDWQEVRTYFSMPAGQMRVYIKSDDFITHLVVDDVEVFEN